jgi:hypothetical protein
MAGAGTKPFVVVLAGTRWSGPTGSVGREQVAAPLNPQDSSGMGAVWFSIADVHTGALGGYYATLLPRPHE